MHLVGVLGSVHAQRGHRERGGAGQLEPHGRRDEDPRDRRHSGVPLQAVLQPERRLQAQMTVSQSSTRALQVPGGGSSKPG